MSQAIYQAFGVALAPDPVMLQLAAIRVAEKSAAATLDALLPFGKRADPMPGGPALAPAAPAPAPAPGGPPGQPMDPAIMQQVAQMMAGGPGGAGAGAPKGKKAEDMILSAQLRNITYLQVLICQKMGITVPPEMLLGPPPDPNIHSQGMQELGNAGAAPNMAADPNAPPVGADPGGGQPPISPSSPSAQGVQPMDMGSGPIGGKQARYGDEVAPVGHVTADNYRLSGGGPASAPAAAPTSMTSLARTLLRGNAR